MNIYTSDRFVLPLPAGHRFPMAKYRLLHERVQASLPSLGARLLEAPRADDTAVLRAHTADYMAKVRDGTLSAAEQRRIGFPWSPEMAERTRRVSGAMMAALGSAIEGCGVGVNLAGGTHHAAAGHGAGYCIFNDSVVAARHVQALGLARRVLVIDLDVHQGDGTASICRDDPSIYTFSIHCARNYPAVKPQGDLDVALPAGTGDAEYLAVLERNLAYVQAQSRPDAVIYLAGADPFAGDALGYLELSKEGLRQRDQMVFDHCRRHSLPVAVSMAGGYAPQVGDIVDIHYATIEAAAALARDDGWYPPRKPQQVYACTLVDD
ncbi:MAG: histone deacetylase [Rhodanobacteraceae bacterium]|nr:histone deacetylase [Rhodanobacteraceae bacterium]